MYELQPISQDEMLLQTCHPPSIILTGRYTFMSQSEVVKNIRRLRKWKNDNHKPSILKTHYGK